MRALLIDIKGLTNTAAGKTRTKDEKLRDSSTKGGFIADLADFRGFLDGRGDGGI